MITQERLKEICTYDPETGLFEGIVNRGKRYKIGMPFGKPEKKGYLQVTIDGRTYHLQRLAWLYVHGVWPEHQIDHRNGIPSDNRLENLRDANRCQQNWNKKAITGKKTPKNVFFLKTTGKYRVRITESFKVRFLAEYETLEEASMVAVEQRRRIHGEFDVSFRG
jgi:hypothetical protein